MLDVVGSHTNPLCVTSWHQFLGLQAGCSAAADQGSGVVCLYEARCDQISRLSVPSTLSTVGMCIPR